MILIYELISFWGQTSKLSFCINWWDKIELQSTNTIKSEEGKELRLIDEAAISFRWLGSGHGKLRATKDMDELLRRAPAPLQFSECRVHMAHQRASPDVIHGLSEVSSLRTCLFFKLLWLRDIRPSKVFFKEMDPCHYCSYRCWIVLKFLEIYQITRLSCIMLNIR